MTDGRSLWVGGLPHFPPIHDSIIKPALPAARALFELLATLETYSDPDFDAHWMAMGEAEVPQVALVLIQALKANLNGNSVSAALLHVRQISDPLN